MPNCEGRSRRSGVILYSDDNDHFVVYTSPPPAAELLLKEKPFGDCAHQLSPIAASDFRAQPSHPWQRTAQLDAGLAKPDRGGKQEANGGKLAFIRAVQAFTCHGGGQGHFQFKTSSFSVHNTGSLLLSSLKKVTSPVGPFGPPPPSSAP